jgi:hypothetical protein
MIIDTDTLRGFLSSDVDVISKITCIALSVVLSVTSLLTEVTGGVVCPSGLTSITLNSFTLVSEFVSFTVRILAGFTKVKVILGRFLSKSAPFSSG